MRRFIAKTIWFAACAMLMLPLCAAQAEPAGQDSSQEVDLTSIPISADEMTQGVAPDNRPITGGFHPGIGSWGPHHSFITPEFSVAQVLESNPLMVAPGVYRGFTSAAALLQAEKYFGRAVELRYVGATRFDSSATIYGADRVTNVHSMSLTTGATLGSWQLLAHDQAQYSQGSATGEMGLEGMGPVITDLSQWGGVAGIQLESVALQGGLAPDQSILLSRGSRLANTILAEADRQLGPRSTVSAVVFYSTLHFFTSEAIDGWQKGAMAGYQRTLSPRDRVGLLYGYTNLGFSQAPGALTTSYVAAMYGRTVSGRLAFDCGGGPETVSISKVAGSSINGTESGTHLGWQGKGDLNYRTGGLGFALSAGYMVTGGAGVLYGAHSTNVTGSFNKHIREKYELSASVGVSRNTSLSSTEQYKTQYVGASLTRGGTGRIKTFLSYNFQNQSAIGCVTANCALAGNQQIFGIGINWDTRPIGIP